MQKDIIHLRAPRGWINDPNGFIYYKGTYHLFYQNFPYAPRWATMHWGHAVSEDLVHWEHQDIALFPTKYEDQNGCFSGSAIEHEGVMNIFYTGVHYDKINPEDTHMCLDDEFQSAQLRITSEDGIHFDNFRDKQVIIPAIENPMMGHKTHTRDPKVWRGSDAWYLVLGSSTADRKGELLFYKSMDLGNWEFVNAASTEEPLGWMWECPDYFETEGGEVLLVSPMGIGAKGTGEKNHTVCMNVRFDEQNCSMEFAKEYQYMDYGFDLYAPQSTTDADGKRVMVAWLRMPLPFEEGRIGMYCLPRLVKVKNDHIYFQPHPNVEQLYSRRITDIMQADPAGYRVSLELNDGEGINVGGYQIWRQGNCILTDRTEVFPACEGRENFCMQSKTPELKDGFHLDVYVNRNVIEVFVNHGEYVISHAVYGCKWQLEAAEEKQMELYTLS